MQSVHIPHDAIIDDYVVITTMCVLDGISRIMIGANLGIGASINQYNVIGPYSIVESVAVAMKNVPPFSRYIPCKPISVNYYALKKYGFEEWTEEIESYSQEGLRPQSKKILSIIEKFEFHSKQSGIKVYE
jgi:UDP-N-acetylglucosamine acyltransferase